MFSNDLEIGPTQDSVDKFNQMWQEIMNSVDTDKDGKVTFEEFKKAIDDFTNDLKNLQD